MIPQELWAPRAAKKGLNCLWAISSSFLKALVWIVPDKEGSNLSQWSTDLRTKNQLSWAQEPLYHWMEHFFSSVEHMLFCHIICKSRVMLQDFYLQPFFFMLGFRQGKWKSISLGWVTEHNFKGIPSFPTFCCFWHKSWELDYLESSRTPQSTFPILSFQNILVFIIRYSQKGEGFINFFLWNATNMRRSRAEPRSDKIVAAKSDPLSCTTFCICVYLTSLLLQDFFVTLSSPSSKSWWSFKIPRLRYFKLQY